VPALLDFIAGGGGMFDKSIRIWNATTRTNVYAVDFRNCFWH
jgi:hypothetical protein